jgi:hypothetical protein
VFFIWKAVAIDEVLDLWWEITVFDLSLRMQGLNGDLAGFYASLKVLISVGGGRPSLSNAVMEIVL